MADCGHLENSWMEWDRITAGIGSKQMQKLLGAEPAEASKVQVALAMSGTAALCRS